jgi:hypothetical protein
MVPFRRASGGRKLTSMKRACLMSLLAAACSSPRVDYLGHVAVLRNLGDGQFESMWEELSEGEVTHVTTVDLDADGLIDIAVVQGGELRVFYDLGKKANTVLASSHPEDPLYVAAPLSLTEGGTQLVAMTKYGHLALIRPGGIEHSGKLLGNVSDIDTADVDGDGNVDLLVTEPGTGSLAVVLNTGANLSSTPIVSQAAFFPQSVSADDFNADGFIDAVIGGGTLNILLGLGDGRFRKQYSSTSGPYLSVDSGDLNGDGCVDAVAAGSALKVFYGDCNGGVVEERDLLLGIGASRAAIQDFDNDGRADILVIHNGRGVAALMNRGESFELLPFLASDGLPITHAIADVDGDGWADIVVGYRAP